MAENNEVVVTELDAVRLERLLHRGDREAVSREAGRPLNERLETARIVAGRQVAADVVTMNSLLRLVDLVSGEESEVRLVYPADLAAGPQRVSVLSPLGQVLLGARSGEVVAAALPGGGYRQYRVERLLFQPEAAGIFDL
ncbi:MAG: GreA/GreB family elongation factor [Steroidobacteraceae bacterium]